MAIMPHVPPATFPALFEYLALEGSDADMSHYEHTNLSNLYPKENLDTMGRLFDLVVKVRQQDWSGVGDRWRWLAEVPEHHDLLSRTSSIFLRILTAKGIHLPAATFDALARIAKHQKLEIPPSFDHLSPSAKTEYESLNKRARPYISLLRDKDLNIQGFRNAADRLAQLMAFETEAALPSETVPIETFLVSTFGVRVHQSVVLVQLLSGDALMNTFRTHFPHAPVGTIDSMKPLPVVPPAARVLILEPMIATGNSLISALALIANKGVKPEQILIVSFVAAPQGLLRLREAYPAVRVLVAQIDVTLNENNEIVPGLGDFGKRYDGT